MTKKKKRKSALLADKAAPSEKVSSTASPAKPPRESYKPTHTELLIAAVVLTLLTLWAYWPTFVWMEDQWRNEPDYSHGYLIFPLALVLLYRRNDLMPTTGFSLEWGGVSLLLTAVVLRVAGRLAYMDFLDGWTIVPWVAGLVWLFCGKKMLLWSLPAVVFLILLTPMPYRFESLLSFKLQWISTVLSSTVLRIFGFPAITEGNTIWLGDQHLMVEEACSGLRIFMGMVAMGFFFAAITRRSWLDKVVILACSAPIAIIANALRVTLTGVAYYWVDAEKAHAAHDQLGIAMIFVGAGMLFAANSFWERLYRPDSDIQSDFLDT